MLFDRLKIFKKMRGALDKTCIWDNLLVARIIFLPVFSKKLLYCFLPQNRLKQRA